MTSSRCNLIKITDRDRKFLFLVKLYVIGATLILLQFEVLSGQAKRF